MGLWNWLRGESRSLENPSTNLSNPAAWFVRMFGSESDSGVTITPESALTIATFWQCVHLLSDDFAKLPTVVYKSNDDKGHKKDREHPAYYLLRRKSHEFMTAGMFKRTILFHALVWGNGYAWIERDEAARPISLLLLTPNSTSPFWHEGRLWYETNIGGKRHILKPEDVFHLRGMGFDGIKGYAVVEFAANSLGLALAAEKFGNKHFSNGSKASGVLHYPGRLKPEAKKNLKESFEAAHQGIDNAHKTIVLEEGAKFVPLTIPPNEAQYIELREFQRKEIGSWFKIPPSKLGDPDSVSYNSLEQWNQAYLEGALDPWLCAFEEEAFDKLLTEVQKKRESHFVEFSRSALLRTDLETRYRAYATAIQWGWGSVNWVLRKESEAPIGPEGDVHLVPQNMADLKNASLLGLPTPPAEDGEGEEGDGEGEKKPGEKKPAEEPAKKPAPKDKQASRDLLEDTFGRMVRRVTGAISKAAKKSDFWDQLDSILADHERAFVNVVRPVIGVIAIVEPTAWFNTERVARDHINTIRQQVTRCKGSETWADLVQQWARRAQAEDARDLTDRVLGQTVTFTNEGDQNVA